MSGWHVGFTQAADVTGPSIQAATLVVSDLHLGLAASRTRDFALFLDQLACERLILLGDILHLPRLYGLPEDARAVLARLAQIVSSRRCQVIWLAGNHDRGAARAVAAEIGVPMVEACSFREHGQRILALHGDCFDPAARRGWWGQNVIARLHAALGARVRWLNELFAAIDRCYNRCLQLEARLARGARTLAELIGADLVLCGHTHRPTIEVDASAPAYANSGSWLGRSASFLALDRNQARMRAFNPQFAHCCEVS